jgi:O-antigen ligase
MAARTEIPAWTWRGGLLFISALVGIVAAINPALGVLAALGLAFMALVLADLVIGLCVFLVITFLDVNPDLLLLSDLLPGFPFPVGVTKLFGLLLAISWLAKVATSTRADRRAFLVDHPTLSFALLSFVVWVGLSSVWAESQTNSGEALLRFALNVLLFPIAYAAVRTRTHVVWVLSALVAGAIASALVGMASGGGIRLTGAAVESNELAATLVAGLALAGGLAAAAASSSARGFALGAAALCALGVFLTASRAGLLAIGVVLVAALFFAGRLRGPAIAGGAIVVVACLGYFAALAPPEARERVTSLETTGRADVWTVAWRMVEANPMIGVGANNFTNSSVHYLLEPGEIERSDFIVDEPKVTHNIYLQMLAELGIVGLALFLAIFLASLRFSLDAANRFRQIGDRRGELLSRGVLLALIGLLTADFFASTQFNNQLWFLLALAPALAAIARDSAVSPTEPSREWRVMHGPSPAPAQAPIGST